MKISSTYSYFLVCILSVYFIVGCQNKKQRSATPTDSPVSGTINISVDESFEPVISEQIKVYEASYPKTKINASYKSEADCFRDLQKDSTRMIIVARGLTKNEANYYADTLTFEPRFEILAYDAVTAIININAKDSVYTLADIRKMLEGKDTSRTVVMDGNNATSTVRYLLDSVLKGKPFGSNVVAANGSRAVVDYVSKNENAIGFVGSSWVTNEQDPEQEANLNKIKFALMECPRNCDPGTFARPSQATISSGQYPLVRPLYYVLKENWNGLGTGFSNYLNLERGQLVFRRSYLVPAKMYFGIRKGKIDSVTIK